MNASPPDALHRPGSPVGLRTTATVATPSPAAPHTLPAELTGISNAPGPLPRPSVFDTLCDRIAAGDAQLCRWMAQGALAEIEDNTMQARSLIASLEQPREDLARHTAEQLLAWLGYKGVALFKLKTDKLKTRIQHAGLHRILAHLEAANPPHGKRVRIGRVLCDCGARPDPVRNALQLTHKELKGTKAAALVELLLSQATAERLQLGELSANPKTAADDARDPHRRQLRGERAEAWQHAAMVNGRFGYDARHPAWKFMRLPRTLRPRMEQLEYLGKTPEALQRHRINVQLP